VPTWYVSGTGTLVAIDTGLEKQYAAELATVSLDNEQGLSHVQILSSGHYFPPTLLMPTTVVRVGRGS
jgi:hypothetical protein